MEISDWISLGGVLGALIMSGWALVYTRSSAKSGKTSAAAAVRSADAADASAGAATRAAEEAARVSHIEREREHGALRPPPPPQIEGEVGGTSPRQALFGALTVPRDYRVQARAWNGTSHTPISLPLLIRANQAYRFCIEHWPDGRTRPQTQEIEFEFWAPMESDGVEMWACPCDRPHTGNEGHWRWRVPVEYTDVTDTIG
ncbi:hypothetical protein [Nonomuraea sp. SYSU D8015]|uniref:hypothetical protein n=1 Tax=Nonomuraea sp. SYSU D8015 TaxID=2593644 RepID=UPI001661692A|nr:hypothetical protein [Nonomuraea sp. SYSU D8015]